VTDVNVFEAELQTDEGDPAGYNASYVRLGPLIAGSKLGMTLYGLPPGQSICAYHYEYGNEEWLLVLEGTPTLRHPDGEDELEPGDFVAFPEGPAGTHKLTNRGEGRVLLGIMSTKGGSVACDLPGLEQDRRVVRARRVRQDHGASRRGPRLLGRRALVSTRRVRGQTPALPRRGTANGA